MTAPYLARLREPKPLGYKRFDPTGGGVTMVVPTHTPAGGDRTGSLRLCLASVLAATPEPVSFVVVDGGLSAPHARRVGELLRATGRPHHIVAAAEHPRNAANARNAGLALLAAAPALRRPKLLLLDDDTALADGALSRLESALAAAPHAIAVCPRVQPVVDLAEAVRQPPGGARDTAHDGVRDTAYDGAREMAHDGARDAAYDGARDMAHDGARDTAYDGARDAAYDGVRDTAYDGARDAVPLPGALGEHGYDLLSVTSHGSLVTGRTVGLLLRQEPVLEWVRANGPLFYAGTPFGSSEDMLAMATLCRLGELWTAPGAVVFDEARRTPDATRMQQFAWGYDHAHLAGALLPPPGVHALEWRDGGWWHGHAHWGRYAGYLVNPAELLFGHSLLSAITAHADTAERMFGAHAASVRAGTRLLGRVLQRWRPKTATPRPDLPPLSTRDWVGLRDGLDALIGHLAGNAAGSVDSSPHFLFGARQPAAPVQPHWSLSWSTESGLLAPAS